MTRGAPGRGGRWPGAAEGTTAIDTASVAAAYDDPLRRQWRRERARRELVLSSIRASLAEEPSAATRRAAARRWVAAIWGLVGELSDEERRKTAA